MCRQAISLGSEKDAYRMIDLSLPLRLRLEKNAKYKSRPVLD